MGHTNVTLHLRYILVHGYLLVHGAWCDTVLGPLTCDPTTMNQSPESTGLETPISCGTLPRTPRPYGHYILVYIVILLQRWL